MVKETNTRLASELQWGLRETSAPPELWDRVQAGRFAARRKTPHVWVWATAAVAVLAVVGASSAYRTRGPGDLQRTGIHCQNPAQLRAWVRAKTGINVPLRAASASSVQLTGARSMGESVEIAYRTGNRGGTLTVSPAIGAGDATHDRASGNVSSWVMAGQRYTLMSDNAADLQLACKLCHLD
jgi:hypothetical protein